MNTTSNNSNNKTNCSLLSHFTRRRIILASCLLIAIGYLLMWGPASSGQTFNPDVFSPRRIVVAPLLCLAGYLLIIVGILRKDARS